jgi:hypothetical protein
MLFLCWFVLNHSFLLSVAFCCPPADFHHLATLLEPYRKLLPSPALTMPFSVWIVDG